MPRLGFTVSPIAPAGRPPREMPACRETSGARVYFCPCMPENRDRKGTCKTLLHFRRPSRESSLAGTATIGHFPRISGTWRSLQMAEVCFAGDTTVFATEPLAIGIWKPFTHRSSHIHSFSGLDSQCASDSSTAPEMGRAGTKTPTSGRTRTAASTTGEAASFRYAIPTSLIMSFFSRRSTTPGMERDPNLSEGSSGIPSLPCTI